MKHLFLLFLLLIVFFQNISAAQFNLTNQEKEWIKNHPVIRVHNESDWPPYNYALNGRPLGFSVDYMNLIAKKTGLKIRYITGPSWNEFLGMMLEGSLDVMLNIVKTPERARRKTRGQRGVNRELSPVGIPGSHLHQ